MLNQNSPTFRIFLSSCHPKQAQPTKEGGRCRRIPICFLCHAASGSSHEAPLNSFASVVPFAVKFQILWLALLCIELFPDAQFTHLLNYPFTKFSRWPDLVFSAVASGAKGH